MNQTHDLPKRGLPTRRHRVPTAHKRRESTTVYLILVPETRIESVHGRKVEERPVVLVDAWILNLTSLTDVISFGKRLPIKPNRRNTVDESTNPSV